VNDTNAETPLRLIVLAGATAGGKTRLGVELAHTLGSEIVSVDSRQVYRGLDIGTGKDLHEYSRVAPPVKVHMIDVADVAHAYSVFEYQRDCYGVWAEKHAESAYRGGRPLVLVGGTGLYLEAVLRNYRIANVPEDVTLRERLMPLAHAELLERLRRIDPVLAQRCDTSSKKRTVRALEVAEYGREHEIRYSEPSSVPFEYSVFVLEHDREELAERIEARLEQRLGNGLIEEVERLVAAGLSRTRMDQLGLEYREVNRFLAGETSRLQMQQELCRAIRRFAKRQRTWFRGLPRRGIPVQSIGADDIGTLLRHPWVQGGKLRGAS